MQKSNFQDGFARHPNRTDLEETNETGNGLTVRLGDTVHIDLEMPVEAKVTSIVRRRHNGKIFVTGTLADESVQTWPSSIVRLGELPRPQQPAKEMTQPAKEMDYDFFVRNEFMTPEEARLLQEQYKKDPSIFDIVKEPKRGTIRTWKVGDSLKNGGKILSFGRYLKPPYGWMVDYSTKGGEVADHLGNMWQHIPPEKIERVQGRTKTWREGNHVRFGHGKEEELWQIKYFVVGDRREPYAVVGLDSKLKLVPVDQLYKHRLEHPIKHAKHQTKTAKKADVRDVPDVHPQQPPPELKPDHELSCPLPHRRLMQENWTTWYQGTREWFNYTRATAEQRAKMNQPPPRDPSQFPVKTFFEVNEQGKNRYGVNPTCVTRHVQLARSHKRFPKDLDDPFKYRFVISSQTQWADPWKRFIYNYLMMAFDGLVKGKDGFMFQRQDMKTHFENEGLDITSEDDAGFPLPGIHAMDVIFKMFYLARRRNSRDENMRLDWDVGGAFNPETFRKYLLEKYGPNTAARLPPKPGGKPPYGGALYLKAYIAMVLFGESRARVLAREGDGKAVFLLRQLVEVRTQGTQSTEDLDAEVREYVSAYKNGDLSDPYRTGIFGDPSPEEREPLPRPVAVASQMPETIVNPRAVTEPPTFFTGVPPKVEVPSVSPSPAPIPPPAQIQALPRLELPERRPPLFETPIPLPFDLPPKIEDPSETERSPPAGLFDTQDDSGTMQFLRSRSPFVPSVKDILGPVQSPPTLGFPSVVEVPERSVERIPEPQIPAVCPPPPTEIKYAKAEEFRLSEDPDQPVYGGRVRRGGAPTAAAVIDLTEPSVDPGGEGQGPRRKRQRTLRGAVDEPSQEPARPDNTIYILIGLVFVGAALWLGDESPRGAVMPYYN